MIEHDGYLWLPILPSDMRKQKSMLSDDRATWPPEFSARYDALRKDFTIAVSEFRRWIINDRELRGTAKAVAQYILGCVNFETGRCDPSYQTIADEIGVSLRTIERQAPKIRKCGWFAVTRRGKTTSNFYQIRVSKEKVNRILDIVTERRDMRAQRRELAKNSILSLPSIPSEPTKVAGHFGDEPTKVAGHEPTKMRSHEPTKMAGKLLNGTCEVEPVNEFSSYEGGRVNLGNSIEADYPSDLATDEPEDPFDPAESVEAGRRFLVSRGVPAEFMQTALHRLMAGALFPCDIESWKEEARGAA